MKISRERKEVFQNKVWAYYQDHGRNSLPWRKGITPYKVWVSEIMLQQTQVDRVISFFKTWMKQFPTIKKLAAASQREVLKYWKGLGYNSRPLRMKKAAQILLEENGGRFPKTYDELVGLPGIGPYTAGAIMAFAYDKPVVFIETNIRRVFIHEFFTKKNIQVYDKQLLELIEQTLPENNIREWYFALMDYGSHLGKTIPNPNKKSRHYTKQSVFKGSDRQIRGKILDILLKNKKNKLSLDKVMMQLKDLISDNDRFERIIDVMHREGVVCIKKGMVTLD